MNSNITVSGNIISELSEKIPSNIIALNELIKNSYDAGAKNINIKIDSSTNKLIISDDGVGMDKSDIDTLFHISNSKKKYGYLNEYNRYTQGSKGLGFLSVFKFGDCVTWRTCKVDGLEFTVDYNELVKNKDISNYNIDINSVNDMAKGTQIEISISEYNINSLKEYFSDEQNSEKVINAFLDDSIKITLEMDDETVSSSAKLKITDYLSERQLYYVKYSSDEQKIKYYYNNILLLEYPYEFHNESYKLEIELQIFQFQKGDKEKISKLFYNPVKDLTPLIYINSNLFNNYNIFDPNVMKNIKSGQTLNQMIGYLEIISNDERINFNSDRTQFLQNELTDNIISFLENINKFIQKKGSEYKKHLVKLDFLREEKIKSELLQINEKGDEILRDLIKDSFKFKDKVNIYIENDKVMYSIFGKEVSIPIEKNLKNPVVDGKPNKRTNPKTIPKPNTSQTSKKTNIVPAVIELKNKTIKIKIPSKQINLYDYIIKAENSSSENIDYSKIDIFVDNIKMKSNVLETVNSVCKKSISYSYLDSNTGIVISSLDIIYIQSESTVRAKDNNDSLISIPTKKSYSIDFNKSLSKLINQINSLKLEDYSEIISCSLRSIFEISIDSIKKCGKFTNLYDGIKKLEERVGKTIELITLNKSYMSEIAKSTDIDYDSLKNVLQIKDFKVAIEKSNLGAHKSTIYIANCDIEQLAKFAALFAVLSNELINNEKIV